MEQVHQVYALPVIQIPLMSCESCTTSSSLDTKDHEEQPPIVELTEAEKKQFFIKSMAQFFLARKRVIEREGHAGKLC